MNGSVVLKLKIAVARVLYYPLILKYRSSANRSYIDLDVDRWCEECGISEKGLKRLIWLLLFRPQFRNIFFFRIQSNSNFLHKICPLDSSISIADDCGEIEGGGLYFEHAYGTIVEAIHIGKNCTLRQLTTFGVKSKNRHDERPWVGNNVDFGANVTCIGNVHVGNNAIIAAGAVVVKNVPENAIVAGNPAKVIKFRDEHTIN